MNIQADRTQEGSLVARRVGRRGRAGRPVADHREGHLQGLPDDARAGRRGFRSSPACTRSHGCSFAESWNARAVPAHAERLAAARRARHRASTTSSPPPTAASLIRNRGSWSIDHQRYNFQFSGQAFYEVRNGKIVGMLKDVAYQSEHAGVLELDGHDRRQVVLLAGRRVQRRQGRAVADQLGEPRLRAGALPERQHPQHGAERMMQTTPAPRVHQPLLSRDEAQGARRSRAVVQQGRRDARDHHQRTERQHALRRREHHHVGRHSPTRP